MLFIYMFKLPKIPLAATLILFFMFFPHSHHVQAAEPAGDGQATVWWKNVSGAATYRIYYRESGETNFSHAARDIPGLATSYTVGYLKRGVTYRYQIVAVDSTGREFWKSSLGSFWAGSKTMQTPQGPVGGTTQGAIPQSTMMSKNSAVASWNADPKTEYYNVYYREVGEKNYTHAVPRIPSEGRNVTIRGLKPGVGYYYKVAAYYGGTEHWMGEKTLVWPVEVVYISNPNWVGKESSTVQQVLPPQPTSQPTNDPFSSYNPNLPPPVTSPSQFY